MTEFNADVDHIN